MTGEAAATFAEGVATRTTFDLTFEILREHLDDVVTLEEEELREGIRLALRTTHNLAEGAGAASLAAAMKLRDQLAGKTVVCVMSGGNITNEMLQQILAGRSEDKDTGPTTGHAGRAGLKTRPYNNRPGLKTRPYRDPNGPASARRL